MKEYAILLFQGMKDRGINIQIEIFIMWPRLTKPFFSIDVYDPDVIYFLGNKAFANNGAYLYCLACQKTLKEKPNLRRADKEKYTLKELQ